MSDDDNLIRAYRARTGITQPELADLLVKHGYTPRPSIAKLSRIENGKQPVPLDMLPALRTITRISGGRLRPDIAKAMGKVA